MNTKQNNKVSKANNEVNKTTNVIKEIKITYLAENIKGKDLLKLKLKANNDNKSELQSLSFCINQFKKHGTELINGFNNISMDEITPKNILPFLTEKEMEKQKENNNKFTFYLVENLVIRYVKNKFAK